MESFDDIRSRLLQGVHTVSSAYDVCLDRIKALIISRPKEKVSFFSDGTNDKGDVLVSTHKKRIVTDLSRCGIAVSPVFDHDAAFVILLLSPQFKKQSADELITSCFTFYGKQCVSPECLGVLNEGDRVSRVGVSLERCLISFIYLNTFTFLPYSLHCDRDISSEVIFRISTVRRVDSRRCCLNEKTKVLNEWNLHLHLL
jgi:hypothetical protein